ncbi:MAG TPA: ABC-F family ATP-binding cassette domain-containing protein [Bacilli bacterium]|nr:ABC-F family ATP-binding cassette domain-containing protein [Bacilli bacterium]
MIITCHHVQKYYGAHLVLSDINLEIRNGDRVGLIGQNGAGKTTLFKLLTGETTPDNGQIAVRKGTKIASLEQIPDYQDTTTVYEVMARAYADIRAAQQEMRDLEVAMAQPDVVEDESRLQIKLRRYEEVREMFERGGGYEMEAHIERVSTGLGIPQSQYRRPFSSLSGGEKTKIGLAAILIEQPDLLLLDEPTNHLDMAAIEWLEGYLEGYQGTVVLISHDRYFLDKVATKVIEIEDGEAFTYHCNYTGYQQEKEERLLREFAAFQEQQKKIKKMKEAIKQLIDWGNRGNPPNPSFHKRAASMQKALDRMEKLKRPVLDRKAMDLRLEQGDRSGKQVVVLEEIAKRFGDRTLFRNVSELLVYGERVFLIGDNGAGKSTIFKMLRGEMAPDAGRVRLGARVEVGYLAQEDAPQEESKTVIEYFREHVQIEEGAARKQLSRFLFYGGDVFKAVKSLSGGEWSRLRLALLMYQKPNLLLLDEPTNHLDILSREALEDALEDYPGTLLIISHDRYFINRLAERLWALEGGSLTNYLGNYDFYKEKRPERVQVVEGAREEASVAAEPVVAPKPTPPPVEAAKPAKKVNLFQKNKLEEQMAALEARLVEIDEALVDPANSTDAGKLADLAAEREQVQAELDAVFERWMEFEA